MLKSKKRMWFAITIVIIIAILVIGMNLNFLSSEKLASAGERVDESVISMMSTYKEIDYSFLNNFNFGGTTDNQIVLTFDTVADLLESTDVRLKSGKYIKTLGYYESGDLGGATYLLAKEKGSYGSILLSNGLYANIVPDKYTDSDGINWVVFSVKQLGAKGDGVNSDNYAINSAISLSYSYAQTDEYDRSIVYIPEGEYKAIDEIQINVKNLNLVGTGNKSIIFTDNDYKKDNSYAEHFIQSWSGENLFIGNFRVEAREVDHTKYMRQMSLFNCNQVYIYNVEYYIPQNAWTGSYYLDKQYTNLTVYSGDKNITVDNCLMYQMSGTYRGANIGIMDFWKGGTENITIMNCELHDNARDEQVGIFSLQDEEDSYIKNVDFINNKVYSYTPPYKELYGNRTMCFTVAYDNTNVDDVNISNNHFISEADSKFMTFGSVTNCVIEENIFEIQSSNGFGSYVFDSSNTSDDNILINNNEFYLTYKDSKGYGKLLSAGHLKFTNNRVLMDCALTKIVERLGTFEGNEFITLNTMTTCGAPTVFLNNVVNAYAGHSNNYGTFYNEIMFQYAGLTEENVVYSGNIINDYAYFNGSKSIERPFDRLSTIINSTFNSVTITNNIYNCQNYSYTDNNNLFITWIRNNVSIGEFICKDNDFQGAKTIFDYGNYDSENAYDISQNMYRDFEVCDNTVAKVSSIDIASDGEVVTEIYTTSSSVKLNEIVRIASETTDEGKVISEEEVTDREIVWLSAIESMATVNEGVVTRNQYGTVSIFATTTDGSGEYARVIIHFVEEKAEDIELDSESLILQPGYTHNVIYKVLPDGKSDKTLLWSSSNEEVATVSDDGIITAVSVGNAEITCTTCDGSNISKNISVIVEPLTVKIISLEESWKYFEEASGTYQIKVGSYTPSDSVNTYVDKWVSSDENVATVDDNGLVTIKGGGIAAICAYSTDENIYATFWVYVKPDKVKNVDVTAGRDLVKLTWDKMESVYGYFVYRYDGNTGEYEKISLVNYNTSTGYTDSGLLANTEYKYYVTAFITRYDGAGNQYYYEGIPSEITVSTYSDEVVQSINIANGDNISTNVGYTVDLNTKYYPANAEIEYLSYEIADDSIAKVEMVSNFSNTTNFKIKGLSVGYTTLKIFADDEKHCELTVNVGVMPNYTVSELEASTDYNTATIKWKACQDEIDGYIVLRTTSIQFSKIAYISLDDLKKGTYSDGEECYAYTDTGLKFGTDYRYKIVPYILHEGMIYTCLESLPIKVSIPEYVAVESVVAETEYVINIGDSKKIIVTATNDNASRKKFLWNLLNKNIATVSAIDENTANLYGVSTGITSIDIIADDEDCNYVTSKVVVLPAMIDADDVKTEVASSEIKLSWCEIEGAAGYNIYKYNLAGSNWEIVKSTKDTFYNDVNLSSGTEYCYKVSAYISDKTGSYEGKLSDVIVTTTSGGEEETTTKEEITTEAESTTQEETTTEKNGIGVEETTSAITDVVDDETTSNVELNGEVESTTKISDTNSEVESVEKSGDIKTPGTGDNKPFIVVLVIFVISGIIVILISRITKDEI